MPLPVAARRPAAVSVVGQVFHRVLGLSKQLAGCTAAAFAAYDGHDDICRDACAQHKRDLPADAHLWSCLCSNALCVRGRMGAIPGLRPFGLLPKHCTRGVCLLLLPWQSYCTCHTFTICEPLALHTLCARVNVRACDAYVLWRSAGVSVTRAQRWLLGNLK